MIRTVFQNGMGSRLSRTHIGHFAYVDFPSNPQIYNGVLCTKFPNGLNGGDTFVFEVGQAVCSGTVYD